ncbi:MAG: hypothetical protein A3F84_18435 [Candidatus Handelsmanbacteria bacterium RIFCSPLOWO2_12_FULL_64_10]|uniref:Uncharacterized protein n=1 Tax=Handelsmanbacteria sp. (strain RIFCSPLOWO2_12_FULL_64_10) TaxID=1817868 RepID=A0A1F6C9X3_HANXR|nr:MAG: hypothetical protein A3F84_18435 [Candidatus Handelsmanbacteria bacterium RIFCSPLOWO2_12_FULL_64_10]
MSNHDVTAHIFRALSLRSGKFTQILQERQALFFSSDTRRDMIIVSQRGTLFIDCWHKWPAYLEEPHDRICL